MKLESKQKLNIIYIQKKNPKNQLKVKQKIMKLKMMMK